MTIDLRRFLFLLAILVIIGTIIIASRYDMHNRILRVEELMVAQARSIVDVVAEASLHGLATNNMWENEVAHRLINNARWVAWLDSCGSIDDRQLQSVGRSMDLFRILVFDPEGRLVAANHAPAASDTNLPDWFLQPLLSGESRALKLGFRREDYDAPRRYVAGASRTGGGAVVVNILADSLATFHSRHGPGQLIKTLGAGQGVRYVVIQDGTGIQASSTSEVDFPLPRDDPFLRPLAEGAEWVAREFTSSLGDIFEVSRVVSLGSGQVLLRVGLDPTPLAQLRSEIRKQSFMRTMIVLATVLLLTTLLVAWQRQAVLDREVTKVTAELRRKEEEVRRSEKLVAMGTLAAGVAHQVRNPLNSIHLIAQVLDRTPGLAEEIREQAKHIRDESARIESIVQQFLHFARPREPVFEELDLAILVREVVQIQAAANQDLQIVLTTAAGNTKGELDRLFMIEVLENLIGNAAEALKGEGRVEVALQTSRKNLVIRVADDGPGVPPGDRERIFDLYYTTRAEGTGLGLSLTAQMVSAMGGSLALDQDGGLEGRGASFVIRLPRRRSKR